MTTPAVEPAAPSSGHAARIAVTLDVINLEASTAFYARLLDFAPVCATRTGLIFESRTLRSPHLSAFELRLRAAFGRKPQGSSGGMLALTLPVADLAGTIERLRPWARWLDVPPPIEPGAVPPEAARLFDPDGYLIELAQAAR